MVFAPKGLAAGAQRDEPLLRTADIGREQRRKKGWGSG